MKNYLIRLLEYEHWANQQVIDALQAVDNPPARAVAVMGHVLSAQHVWTSRILNTPASVAIWEDTPVSWMQEIADRQHRQLMGYLEPLSDLDLDQVIAYSDSKGNPHKSTLLDILTQLNHHDAYHRGQVVQLIRPLVKEVPLTDFIFWARQGK